MPPQSATVAGPAELTNDTRESLLRRYRAVREASVEMCRPLQPEAFRLQPAAEVSPPWWNLGHTSWFFARNVLKPFGGEYLPVDEQYDYLLNSYYVSLGSRLARDRRGLVTRPSTDEIYEYRRSVDRRVERLIETVGDDRLDDLAFVVTIGTHHEQQHQELFYTEIKAILAGDPPPLRVAYRPGAAGPGDGDARDDGGDGPVEFAGGLFEFGNLEGGWCWDNELPVHKQHLEDFALRRRLVTCGEYLEFIEDGGYRRPLLWLDNGWAAAAEHGWGAPLYCEKIDGEWMVWTLGGLRPLDAREPVCHVSFYEADAFARWKSETWAEHRGARLPTEREWEHAARQSGANAAGANLLDAGRLHPAAASGEGLVQMIGDCWEWTASYYEGYPGYDPFPGVLSEYNAKFMDNQRVMRGGSCVTPADHVRLSYRNFWPAQTRFQMTGIRLAGDR